MIKFIKFITFQMFYTFYKRICLFPYLSPICLTKILIVKVKRTNLFKHFNFYKRIYNIDGL